MGRFPVLLQAHSWLLEDMVLTAHVGREGVGQFGFPDTDFPAEDAFIVSGGFRVRVFRGR
jgi:hypothetical protein